MKKLALIAVLAAFAASWDGGWTGPDSGFDGADGWTWSG